jgi:hypothetical protein
MSETLRDACTPIGTQKWHWYNVINDLIKQGGLKEEDVQWSFRDPGLFLYKGKSFFMSWVKNQFLLVSMKKDDEGFKELVEALAKVVEYRPFCRYVEPESGLTTYEWDKIDPKGRYKKLEGDKKDLVKL